MNSPKVSKWRLPGRCKYLQVAVGSRCWLLVFIQGCSYIQGVLAIAYEYCLE